MDADIVDERLLFYGFDDFFKNRVFIKALFATKSLRDKCIYRWYLYSRPFISETAKNYMWDYLQGDMSEYEFILSYRSCVKRVNI